jgi:Trp operon repressor
VNRFSEIAAVLSGIEDPKMMELFLKELFTDRELATLELRWRLLQDLFVGIPQRKIAETHRISLCKITRGSKVLKKRGSVARRILEAAQGNENEPDPPRPHGTERPRPRRPAR